MLIVTNICQIVITNSKGVHMIENKDGQFLILDKCNNKPHSQQASALIAAIAAVIPHALPW